MDKKGKISRGGSKWNNKIIGDDGKLVENLSL